MAVNSQNTFYTTPQPINDRDTKITISEETKWFEMHIERKKRYSAQGRFSGKRSS